MGQHGCSTSSLTFLHIPAPGCHGFVMCQIGETKLCFPEFSSLFSEYFSLGLVTIELCGRSQWSSRHCGSWKVDVDQAPPQPLTQLVGGAGAAAWPTAQLPGVLRSLLQTTAMCECESVVSIASPAVFPQQWGRRLGRGETSMGTSDGEMQTLVVPALPLLCPSFLSLSLACVWRQTQHRRQKSQARLWPPSIWPSSISW